MSCWLIHFSQLLSYNIDLCKRLKILSKATSVDEILMCATSQLLCKKTTFFRKSVTSTCMQTQQQKIITELQGRIQNFSRRGAPPGNAVTCWWGKQILKATYEEEGFIARGWRTPAPSPRSLQKMSYCSSSRQLNRSSSRRSINANVSEF